MSPIPLRETVILLAEDDPVVRNLIYTMLLQAGYAILAANDGQEALELCRAYTDPIHLLLTDYAMPRLDGLTLIERVRKLRPEMRVIVMSGDTTDIIRTQNRPDAFLPKPFKPPTLLKCVQKVLQGATQIQCDE